MKPFATTIWFAASLAMMATSPVLGEELAKPALVLGAPAASQNEPCVDVQIGEEKLAGLGCLNQELRHQADAAHPAQIAAPLDSSSPAARVGGFSEAGLAQQYGRNFGKSAVPQRPDVPTFTPPLGTR